VIPATNFITPEALELLRQYNGALKAREKRRINSLQILQFNSRDIELISKQHRAVQEFGIALGLNVQITADRLRNVLEDAHRASEGYYTLKHAEQWNTDLCFRRMPLRLMQRSGINALKISLQYAKSSKQD